MYFLLFQEEYSYNVTCERFHIKSNFQYSNILNFKSHFLQFIMHSHGLDGHALQYFERLNAEILLSLVYIIYLVHDA